MGMSFGESVNLLIVYNAVGIPARIFSGLIADRLFGVLNTFIPYVMIQAIIAFCWLGVKSAPGYYVYIAFYGLFSAGFQSLFPTAISSLTPDLRKTGTRLGMAFSMLSIAGLTGPPLGGALLTTDGGRYLAPLIWAGAAMLLGACLTATARCYRYGFRLKTKC